MLNSTKHVFEFRFYTSQNEKLNYNQPDLSVSEDQRYLYNVMEPGVPSCPRLKPRDFDEQYSYYIQSNDSNTKCTFSVYLSATPNFNVSYNGALGIFIRKVLVIHYPDAPNGSHLRIYLPNCATPISKLVKATFRLDCDQDLVLSLKDDYSIELL
jgi:non-ribosomal peptide synthetase component E (peptide arylation enzyme)